MENYRILEDSILREGKLYQFSISKLMDVDPCGDHVFHVWSGWDLPDKSFAGVQGTLDSWKQIMYCFSRMPNRFNQVHDSNWFNIAEYTVCWSLEVSHIWISRVRTASLTSRWPRAVAFQLCKRSLPFLPEPLRLLWLLNHSFGWQVVCLNSFIHS